MIWHGETTEQFWDRITTTWQTKFAWYPVQLNNGDWLWWEHYERKSQNYGPSILDIRWENRIPADAETKHRRGVSNFPKSKT